MSADCQLFIHQQLINLDPSLSLTKSCDNCFTNQLTCIFNQGDTLQLLQMISYLTIAIIWIWIISQLNMNRSQSIANLGQLYEPINSINFDHKRSISWSSLCLNKKSTSPWIYRSLASHMPRDYLPFFHVMYSILLAAKRPHLWIFLYLLGSSPP